MYTRLSYQEGELSHDEDISITIYNKLDEDAPHVEAKTDVLPPLTLVTMPAANRTPKILDKLKKAACFAVPIGMGRAGINAYYSKEKYPEMSLEEAKLKGLLDVEEEKTVINWRPLAAFFCFSTLLVGGGSFFGAIIGSIFNAPGLGATVGASASGGITTAVYASRCCFFTAKFERKESNEKIDLQRLDTIPVDVIKIIASYSPTLYQGKIDVPAEPILERSELSRPFLLLPRTF